MNKIFKLINLIQADQLLLHLEKLIDIDVTIERRGKKISCYISEIILHDDTRIKIFFYPFQENKDFLIIFPYSEINYQCSKYSTRFTITEPSNLMSNITAKQRNGIISLSPARYSTGERWTISKKY